MHQFCPYIVSCKPLSNEFSHLKEAKLTTPCFSIGRGLNNTLQIPSLTISRHHCKLMKKDNSWIIEDNSTFGIKINDTRVGKGHVSTLNHGDTITLDYTNGFVYKFLCEDEGGTPSKRIKLDESNTNLISNERNKLEEFQNNEVKNIEEQLHKNNKLKTTNKLLVEQLDLNMARKNKIINKQLTVQVVKLTGEDVSRQVALTQPAVQQRTKALEELQEVKNQKKVIESNSNTEVVCAKRVGLAEKKNHEIQVQLNEQKKAMKKLEQKDKEVMEQLRREKEEMNKKLIESQNDAKKFIADLMAKVAAKEKELEALTNLRIQKINEQSNKTIFSLQEQLKKVSDELKSSECEKQILENTASTFGECSKKLGEIGDIMETELQCSICAELFITPWTLNCSHSFCEFCITMWKKKKHECPICRASITSDCKSLALDSFIEKMIEKLSPEIKQKREEMLQARIGKIFLGPSPRTIAKFRRWRRTRRPPRSSIPIYTPQIYTSASNPIPIVDLTFEDTPQPELPDTAASSSASANPGDPPAAQRTPTRGSGRLD